jgi:hypothetical protein
MQMASAAKSAAVQHIKTGVHNSQNKVGTSASDFFYYTKSPQKIQCQSAPRCTKSYVNNQIMENMGII